MTQAESDQPALGPDGQLLDALKIAWYGGGPMSFYSDSLQVLVIFTSRPLLLATPDVLQLSLFPPPCHLPSSPGCQLPPDLTSKR